MARIGAASQEEMYMQQFLPKTRKTHMRMPKKDQQEAQVEDVRVYTEDHLDRLYYVEGYTTQ